MKEQLISVTGQIMKALFAGNTKQGVLFLSGQPPQPSVAVEFIESKGSSWIEKGWSLDAVLTAHHAGMGVSKDLYKTSNLEIDVGGYVVNNIDELLNGKISPKAGLGLHLNF